MNGDGRDDVITGHYWPGDIHFFARKADASFAGVDYLKDEAGRNLNAGLPWVSQDESRRESLAAAPYATDFDGDGDFDMLIGNIEGNVVLVRNIGTRTAPLFSKERTKLLADGDVIRVAGGDAAPVHADWDGDGKRDLIVGSGVGAVLFFENVGTETAPSFAAAQHLVARVPSVDVYRMLRHGERPTASQLRSKVAVGDYNGDGLIDLLVGDYWREAGVAPELSQEQMVRRDELRVMQAEISAQYGRLMLEGGVEGLSAEALDDYSERLSAVYAELSPLEPHDHAHGHVWFLRRLPAEVVAIPANASK